MPAPHLVLVTPDSATDEGKQLGGWGGTLQDLEEMRAMVRRDLGLDNPDTFNQTLFQVAGNIVSGWHAKTEEERLRAAFEFVVQNVTWTPDPTGNTIRLLSPLTTLNQREADCDELTPLLAVLVGMVGVQRAAFRALRLTDTPDGSYDHVELAIAVAPETSASGKMILDPSAQDRPFGWYVTDYVEEAYYDIWGDEEAGKLSGFWSSIAGIAGIVAAPFTAGASLAVTAAVAGGIAAGGLIGQKLDAKSASAAQQKEIAKEWDALCAQLESDIQRTFKQTTITPADYQNLLAEYTKIEQISAQYSAIDYISEHWNSSAYKQAFEQQLGEIQAASNVAQPSVATSILGDTAASSATVSGINTTELLVAGAVVLGLIFIL